MHVKTILCMVLMAALSFCPKVQAQQYNPESDFEVKIMGGGKSVRIVNYVGTERIVNIPPQIRKLPVTHIGDGAFRKKNLTGVTIPNSVREIGITAFFGNQLTSITIPNSVTKIELGAFAINRLTSITIPNSVTSIAKFAFMGNQLTDVTIGNRVATIEKDAFQNNQLTSITIPDNVRLLSGERVSKEQGIEDVFSFDFDSFYESQGRKAGTYTCNDGKWELAIVPR